jgi:hypothetical protein
MDPRLLAALRVAAQGVRFALDTYRALRDALRGTGPDVDAAIAELDRELASAVTELGGVHVLQMAELGPAATDPDGDPG